MQMKLATPMVEPHKILIVDDDPDELFATSRILKKQDLTVETAGSGSSALELVESYNPDIILLDVVMPEMDGFEICRHIKSQKKYDQISIILVSNHRTTPEYVATGLDAGADEFISRPCNVKEFVSRVKSIVRLKTVERELRVQQQWMHVTLSSIGDGLIATDDTETIVFMNPAAEQITGWNSGDACGQTFESVFHIVDDDTGDRIDNPIRKALKIGKAFELKDNVNLLKKQGSQIPIADSVAPIKQTNDDIIGGVVIFRDVAEKKQSEKALKKSAQEWEFLFKAIGQITLVVDPDHRILDANDAAMTHFKMDQADMIGKRCFELFHDSSHPPKTCPMIKALVSKEQEAGEVAISRLDGDHIVSCTPILDDQGKIEKIIHISTDITPFKKAEQERRTIERQLQQAQKLEAIGTLAGGIAHDFNNILSSILGFAEISLEEIDTLSRSALEDNLKEIYNGGKRARDLVRQILTFARRQTQDSLEPVNMGLVIKEVVKFLRSTVPVTIDICHTINTDACVQGDSTRVHQVIMNLCTNAVQAMENTGGKLGIHLNLKHVENQTVGFPPKKLNGDYLELVVSDTGAGIPETIQNQIFEPYFSTKKSKEGTGLGLSTVLGVVQDCDGTVDYQSNTDVGSRFRVYLPASQQSLVEAEMAVQDLPTGCESILFIDDELPIAKMGTRMLSSLGYRVTAFTDSGKAFQMFERNPEKWDIVVSDITMPKITGDDLAQRIREIRSDIPIILCTGYSKRTAGMDNKTLGVDALCFKPIMIKDLAVTVRQALDTKTKK
jgi:PAS domain S-box-containing protein